jgi:ADP-heptose:LPS heptosyltransferase
MAGGPTLARGAAGDEHALTDGWVEGGSALTGGRWERNGSAGRSITDLGGRTTFAELAAVLAGASAMVVANTGPAHLAAAVGTPVVSLFAPVVPAGRWAPYGVPTVILGDQQAPCRGTQARACPVSGHPCLMSVSSDQVVEAVNHLVCAKEDVR